MYQPRNEWEKISPFVVSGLSPRGYNPKTVLQMAETEKRSGMNAVQKAVYDGGKLRDGFSTAVRTTGVIPSGQLPKPLLDATVAHTKIQANYARAGVKPANPKYQQHAFTVDVATLVKWGKVTQAQADTALKWAGTQEAGTIQKERDRLRSKYFGGAAISDARAKLQVAAERRAFTDDVVALLRSGTINTDQAKQARAWGASASAAEAPAESPAASRGAVDGCASGGTSSAGRSWPRTRLPASCNVFHARLGAACRWSLPSGNG